MNSNEVVFIGLGQCGNNITNDLNRKNRHIHTVYINTSRKDIDCLTNVVNKYIIPNADGCGRDRDKAKEYIKMDANTSAISDLLSGFADQKYFYIAHSVDGGSGSGMALMICALLNTIRPDAKVGLVSVYPRKNETKKAHENAIDFWNELNEMNLPNLGNIYMIDNNQYKTNEEINYEFVNKFNRLLNIADSKKDGSLDSADAEKLLTGRGICGIYDFDITEDEDIFEYVDDMMENSIFMVKSKTFEYIGISAPNHFDIDDENDFFDTFNAKLDKSIIRSDTNEPLLVLSGSKANSSLISSIKRELKKKEKNLEELEKEEQDLQDNLIVERKKRVKKQTAERKTIDELFSNGSTNIWDDILNR